MDSESSQSEPKGPQQGAGGAAGGAAGGGAEVTGVGAVVAAAERGVAVASGLQGQEEEINSTGKRGSGKLGHRSQSSPSSLTTHKFGLRPTPSPPRLVIDHQTGDIIETYPKLGPVYLRTYQPVEPADQGEEEDLATAGAAGTDEEELALRAEARRQRRQQAAEYKRLLRHQTKPLQPHQTEDFLSSQDELSAASTLAAHALTMSGHRNQPPTSASAAYRPAIPPPHSGKVYFAPPATSGSTATLGNQPHHHLFRPQESLESIDDLGYHQKPPPAGVQAAAAAANGSSGAHNQSFKRALNKLQEGRTDIAILTEPNSYGNTEKPLVAARQQQIKVTATPKKQAAPRGELAAKTLPAIEHFSLYDLCYQFRALLVGLLSLLIIYLLVWPLRPDCAAHRPTHSYVSIILASVNLTCLLVFTLFWYCSGVTRTLYANLSSSAFIVAIYTILVALNLALAILFFFTNTCHFQKLSETPHLIPHPPLHHLNHIELGSSNGQPPTIRRRRHSMDVHRWDREELAIGALRARRYAHQEEELQQPPEFNLAPVNNLDRHNLEEQQQQQQETPPVATPSMSPLEAAWEWACEQVQLARRHFRLFLRHYDLRFIGALHALCAICLQYMAMKVAVVRSHFCCGRPLARYL